jgi:hypothetical protein
MAIKRFGRLEPVQILLAAYSGTANVVLTNLPHYLHEVRVLLVTDGDPSGYRLRTFTLTDGTATSLGSNFGADPDGTYTTTTIEGANQTAIGAAFTHPSGSLLIAEDGTGSNVIDIRLPDFANASGLNSTQRSIYSLAYTPPGSLATQGFTVATTKYTLTSGSAKITGFTIALNSVGTRVYVYGL